MFVIFEVGSLIKSMIRAVIFDLNGVFVKSRFFSERFEEKYGISQQEFIAALNSVMTKVRLPNAGDTFEHWEPYLDKWGLKITKDDFLGLWFSGENQVYEVVTIAKELKDKGLKVFILSNNFQERADYYRDNFPFLEEIADKIYYSWQTGFVKPDVRAYQNILDENNLKPEECIYFDDSEENIKVSTQLGIKSFIFKDPEDTREILEENI